MPVGGWINRTAGVAARNGTSTHTITFASDGDAPFAPTDGRLLVMVVAAPVTNAWSAGWTEQLSPTANTELSVATITAATTTSVTLTHNASNRPIAWVVYEFPAGWTWVSGASSSGAANNAAQPTVSSLPVRPVTVFYGVSSLIDTTGGATLSATWTTGVTEDVDSFTDDNATTDGVWLGVAYTSTDASSAATTPTLTNGRASLTERVSFAVGPAAVTVLANNTVTASLEISVAWGADATADPDTWLWSDITADVLVDDGEHVTWTVGRQDEASEAQPAQAVIRLDNRAGDYSLGPQSRRWPYVRRATPLRIRVTYSGTVYARFLGFIDVWQPEWDQTGQKAVVTVTASGLMRRLKQGKGAVPSPLRRYLTARDEVVAYWPMEDGASAKSAASAIEGHPPLSCSIGAPQFADDSSTFVASAALPDMDFSNLQAVVPAFTTTTAWQVRVLVSIPEGGLNDGVPLLTVYTQDTTAVWAWGVNYGVGGTLRILAYGSEFSPAYEDTGAVAFEMDGHPCQLTLSVWQDGADIAWELATIEPSNPSTASTFGSAILGETNSDPARLVLCRGGLANPIMGHCYIEDSVSTILDVGSALSAHHRERAHDRFARLCEENGLTYGVDGYSAASEPMGVQPRAGLAEMLRECEVAEQGFVVDAIALTQHLALVARASRVRTTADTTLTAGDLLDLTVVDDDQTLRNRATASRPDGGTATVSDTDGPLGTTAVGIYEDSVTVNCAYDAQVPSYAGWLVHLGTGQGFYRYPSLRLDLAACTPARIPELLLLSPTRRVDVTGLSTYRTQHPAGTIESTLVGVTNIVDRFSWVMECNLAPYQPWKIAKTATDATYGFRTTSSGSTLSAQATAGATTLSVATPSGPLWTTAGGDFPMSITVGQLAVSVTGISGGSSPQTFTLSTALSITRPSGSVVQLASAVLDL